MFQRQIHQQKMSICRATFSAFVKVWNSSIKDNHSSSIIASDYSSFPVHISSQNCLSHCFFNTPQIFINLPAQPRGTIWAAICWIDTYSEFTTITTLAQSTSGKLTWNSGINWVDKIRKSSRGPHYFYWGTNLLHSWKKIMALWDIKL